MANSIDITHSNGIYTILRGTQRASQGRTLEDALENALIGAFPPEAVFHAAQVIEDIMGEISETHGQIATRTPE